MPNNASKTIKKDFLFPLSPLTPPIDAAWYVINTYSGHEYKVIDALKIRIKTMGLESEIFQAILNQTRTSTVKPGGLEGIYLTFNKNIFSLSLFYYSSEPS